MAVRAPLLVEMRRLRGNADVLDERRDDGLVPELGDAGSCGGGGHRGDAAMLPQTTKMGTDPNFLGVRARFFRLGSDPDFYYPFLSALRSRRSLRRSRLSAVPCANALPIAISAEAAARQTIFFIMVVLLPNGGRRRNPRRLPG